MCNIRNFDAKAGNFAHIHIRQLLLTLRIIAGNLLDSVNAQHQSHHIQTAAQINISKGKAIRAVQRRYTHAAQKQTQKGCEQPFENRTL